MRFNYVNYRGEVSQRTVTPVSYRFGVSQWYPEPQWLMMALDHDKNQPREFALDNMSNIEETVAHISGTGQSPLRDLIMRLDLVAQNHIAYSQACGPLGNLRDHLSAIAFAEEVNNRMAKEAS